MPIVVRPAEADDVGVIRELSERAFSTVRHIYQPSARALEHRSSLALEALIAFRDGMPAGVVQWALEDDALRVIGLAVLPEQRRHGIARSFIERLSRIAAERGCRALTLHTVVQTGNVAVFERLGFQVIEERPDAYSVSPNGDPLTEAYMERICTGPVM
jgi:ribosomal protein S18 acetylase RimI-like enzyme